MSEKKPKIFISYSWEDKAISRRLADCLQRDGVQVWIDYSENKAGDSFIRKMNSGLEWCDTFVLLWSKSAEQSEFVSLEWEGALANKVKIIPCLLDKTNLPFILSGRIYKDFSNFDEGYSSLAKDLNLVVKEEKPKEVKKVVRAPEKRAVSKPEIIKSEITIFRSDPKELSEADVISMLKKYDFFASDYNQKGKGFNHQYEAKTIKGDKIVIDKSSGLMWQQSGSSEDVKRLIAERWIKELNKKGFAGFTDWRLPTLEEAMSLMEPEEGRKIAPIFDFKQNNIWTADRIKNTWGQWIVSYWGGICYKPELNSQYCVRAVRSARLSTE